MEKKSSLLRKNIRRVHDNYMHNIGLDTHYENDIYPLG